MARDSFQQKSHWVLIGVLVLISYVLLMFGNNAVSLTHPDEVFYTQSAKEMVAHNSWLTPMIFDGPQFEKPFLFYAMMALLIKFFGLSPAIARFWPGFFGVLGVCITYWIAWMLFERKRLAFLSGLILGSSFIYLALSRAVLTDVVFSIFVAISIGFFYSAYKYEDKRTSGTILFFVFAAIAVLTKGLLGLTFTVGSALIFLAYKKDLGMLKAKAVWIGFLLFLAIALPWHILMYKEHGVWFLEEYFRNVHIRRLFVSEHPKINTWYFYIALMIVGVLPWTFFSIPAWGAAFKKFKDKADDRDKYFFLFSWIIGVYIFVQPAQSKLASYIFPVFPAIAILIGAYLDDTLQENEKSAKQITIKICGYIASAVLLCVAIASIVFGQKYIDILVSMKPMYILSAVAMLVSITILVFAVRSKHTKMVYAHTGVTVALLFCVIFARPYVEPWVSCKGISDELKKIDTSDSIILASKFYVRGIRYYTDRKMAVIAPRDKGFFSPHPMPYLNTDTKIREFLSTQDVTYAVVKESDVEELHRLARVHPFTVKELEGIGGKYIMKIEKIKPFKKY